VTGAVHVLEFQFALLPPRPFISCCIKIQNSLPSSRACAQDLSLGTDRRPRAGVRGGSWGGAASRPHQLGSLREHCEPPARFGGAPTAQRFSIIFSTQDGLSDTVIVLIVQPFEGQDPCVSPCVRPSPSCPSCLRIIIIIIIISA